MKKGYLRTTLAIILGLVSPVLLCSDQPGPALLGVACLIACLLCLGSVERQEGAK